MRREAAAGPEGVVRTHYITFRASPRGGLQAVKYSPSISPRPIRLRYKEKLLRFPIVAPTRRQLKQRPHHDFTAERVPCGCPLSRMSKLYSPLQAVP